MINFIKKYKYDGKIDPEIIYLCDAMNALPGIQTINSCCGHGAGPFTIWFRVTSDKGIFFLARCVDRRYWKYGYLWKIEISVGDVMRDGILPTSYLLNSGPIVGEDAYEQAKSLIENMNHHLNNINFMNGYELDINDFDL